MTNDEMIAQVQKIYTEIHGNKTAIAEQLGVPRSFVRRHCEGLEPKRSKNYTTKSRAELLKDWVPVGSSHGHE